MNKQKVKSIESENMWQELKCLNCGYVYGMTDAVSLIVGNCLIRQPRTNLLCAKCGRIRSFHSPSDAKLLKTLTETEIKSITGLQ